MTTNEKIFTSALSSKSERTDDYYRTYTIRIMYTQPCHVKFSI